MIPPDAPILLDTNILIYWFRGKARSKALAALYDLGDRKDRPWVSVISLGEARSLTRKWDWSPTKVQLLINMLRELPVLDIYHESVIEAYAEIDHFSRKSGQPMSQNDLWIAALCVQWGIPLLTRDRHFTWVAALEVRCWTLG